MVESLTPSRKHPVTFCLYCHICFAGSEGSPNLMKLREVFKSFLTDNRENANPWFEESGGYLFLCHWLLFSLATTFLLIFGWYFAPANPVQKSLKLILPGSTRQNWRMYKNNSYYFWVCEFVFSIKAAKINLYITVFPAHVQQLETE